MEDSILYHKEITSSWYQREKEQRFRREAEQREEVLDG